MTTQASFYVDHASTALPAPVMKAFESLLAAIDAAGLSDHSGINLRVEAAQAELARDGTSGFRTRQELGRLARYVQGVAGDVPGLGTVSKAAGRLERRTVSR